MAGIHGKNAKIRVSTSETVLSGTVMSWQGTEPDVYQVASGSRDWAYDRDRTLIQFENSNTHSSPDDVDTSLNVQSRLINFAGGAVHLGQYGVTSGVYAMAVSMELTTIANLVGDSRNFTVRVEQDTVDSTVIGDSWKSTEDGLAGFEGSLEGLTIDQFWYKRAVSTLSGLIPRTVLRLGIDPKDTTTYYQGTVIFPSWEMSGGYDSVVEHSTPFEGRGPLDLIQAGVPFFKIHSTT